MLLLLLLTTKYYISNKTVAQAYREQFYTRNSLKHTIMLSAAAHPRFPARFD